MKLKLEAMDGITILSVSDFIGPQHLAVLKAGLLKLFQSGKKTVLMDLAGLAEESFQPLEVTQEIAALPSWALEQGGHLTIASPIPGLGDTPNREKAMDALTSPLGKMMALEARLMAQLKTIEAKKDEIEKRIASMSEDSGDIRELKRENRDLKSRVADLEKQIRTRLETRTNVSESQLTASKIEAASRILISVLEQEGVLPVV